MWEGRGARGGVRVWVAGPRKWWLRDSAGWAAVSGPVPGCPHWWMVLGPGIVGKAHRFGGAEWVLNMGSSWVLNGTAWVVGPGAASLRRPLGTGLWHWQALVFVPVGASTLPPAPATSL